MRRAARSRKWARGVSCRLLYRHLERVFRVRRGLALTGRLRRLDPGLVAAGEPVAERRRVLLNRGGPSASGSVLLASESRRRSQLRQQWEDVK